MQGFTTLSITIITYSFSSDKNDILIPEAGILRNYKHVREWYNSKWVYLEKFAGGQYHVVFLYCFLYDIFC